MKLRALITDDELPGRENLSAILSKYIREVEVVGMAASVTEAKEKIRQLKPDLLFLDIELGDGSGFDVLENLEMPNLFVVFVTAYSSYAARAFRTDATDYLLKPIDVEDLQIAIQKVRDRKNYQQLKTSQDEASSKEEAKKPELIKVVTNDGNEYIPSDKVVLMMSINYLTRIVLEDGRELIAGKHLKEYEKQLLSDHFIRVHNSFLINPLYFDSIKGSEHMVVIMKNGREVPVSRRKKEAILHVFGAKK